MNVLIPFVLLIFLIPTCFGHPLGSRRIMDTARMEVELRLEAVEGRERQNLRLTNDRLLSGLSSSFFNAEIKARQAENILNSWIRSTENNGVISLKIVEGLVHAASVDYYSSAFGLEQLGDILRGRRELLKQLIIYANSHQNHLILSDRHFVLAMRSGTAFDLQFLAQSLSEFSQLDRSRFTANQNKVFFLDSLNALFDAIEKRDHDHYFIQSDQIRDLNLRAQRELELESNILTSQMFGMEASSARRELNEFRRQNLLYLRSALPQTFEGLLCYRETLGPLLRDKRALQQRYQTQGNSLQVERLEQEIKAIEIEIVHTDDEYERRLAPSMGFHDFD